MTNQTSRFTSPFQYRATHPLTAMLGALCTSSALSMALLAVRVVYTDRLTFVFLAWNLALAWIPLFCAAAAWRIGQKRRTPTPAILLLLVVWLLFFPNSPYILTDLLHLHARDGSPLWYDLMMLLSFAWSGLMLGFTSLWLVEALARRWFGRWVAWIVVGGALAGAAFGIYLGRFLRWNSWDVIANPTGLLSDVLVRLVNPLDYLRTFAVTLLLVGFLVVVYLTLASYGRLRSLEGSPSGRTPVSADE